MATKISFKAHVNMDSNQIKIKYNGRWYNIRYYQGKKKIPSKKIQQECLYTFWLNTGRRLKPDFDHYSIIWI